MKIPRISFQTLIFAALPLALSVLGMSCSPNDENRAEVAAPNIAEPNVAVETPSEIADAAPTAAPIVIQSGKSSLPPAPQMIGDRENAAALQNAPRSPSIAAPGRALPLESRPQRGATPFQTPTSVAIGNEMVWVNHNSKIFHRRGSRFFGTTQNGRFVSETTALRAGYRESKKR